MGIEPRHTHALSVNWSGRHHYEQVQTAYSKRRILNPIELLRLGFFATIVNS